MFDEFVKELREKNISITFSKGKLQYSGAEEVIDEELISKLKEYKNKLLKHFWPKECVNMMPINTEGDLAPLILLHAGPANYPISEYLGNNRPFYGFFYIGSEGEKIRYKRLEDFAGEYLRQLQNVLPEGPYLLGGLSMGGNLAFEMAIHLQNQGHKVPFLILVDSVLAAYRKPVYYPQLIKRICYKFYKIAKAIYRWSYNITMKMIYDTFAFIFNNLPKKKRKAYIIWIYEELIRRYKPSTEFKGEILLFRSSENNFNREKLGWENVCKKIKMVTFKGNHSAMFHDKESIDLIKTHIGDWLNATKN